MSLCLINGLYFIIKVIYGDFGYTIHIPEKDNYYNYSLMMIKNNLYFVFYIIYNINMIYN